MISEISNLKNRLKISNIKDKNIKPEVLLEILYSKERVKFPDNPNWDIWDIINYDKIKKKY